MADNKGMSNYDMEVVETAIDQMAGMVATYYTSLMEKGIDKDFSESLTIEYQACLLEMIQNRAANQ